MKKTIQKPNDESLNVTIAHISFVVNIQEMKPGAHNVIVTINDTNGAITEERLTDCEAKDFINRIKRTLRRMKA